jgi:hypothetical protein
MNPKSRAQKIKVLLKKYKKWSGEYYDTKDFKEPALLLLRRTNRVEFFEDATQGEFYFEHSDGSQRMLLLNPRYQQTFDYGKKTFRGYICHEDQPLPYPTNVELTSELVTLSHEKTLNTLKEWKAKEIKAKGDLVWKIGGAIAMCILAYAMYKLMVPGDPTPEATVIKEIVNPELI